MTNRYRPQMAPEPLPGDRRPFSSVEAVVPFAPVPDIAPAVLKGAVRRQDRSPHRPGWSLDPLAAARGAPVARWSEFRASFERVWSVGDGWQLAQLAAVTADDPLLGHLADAALLGEVPTTSDLLADLPSEVCKELLGGHARMVAAIARSSSVGVMVETGSGLRPLGAALTGPAKLDSGGALTLHPDGTLRYEGQALRGWQLTGGQVEVLTSNGSGPADALTSMTLIRLSHASTPVTLTSRPAVETLGDLLASLWQGFAAAAELQRSCLLVTADVILARSQLRV
jgi:hypothetical protein